MSIAPRIIVCLMLISCAGNPPEELRRDLRAASRHASDSRRSGEITQAIQILNESVPTGDALAGLPYKPELISMRSQAANNLGQFAAIEGYDALFNRGISELADASSIVRRECVIALGKLRYSGPLDPLRVRLPALIRERLIGQGASGGSIPTFPENDRAVRRALLDTLITLGMPPEWDPEQSADIVGYRDVAGELHTIAQRLSARESFEREHNALLHEAMLERTFDGLRIVTGTPRASAQAKRAELYTPEAYIEWWVERISMMPRMDDYRE